MTEVTPVTSLFNSGSYEEDLYAKSLGWETPSMLILERAIVISVNLGIDINPTASYLPQFAINARLIGGTTSAYIPETEIPEWSSADSPSISNPTWVQLLLLYS